MKQLTAAALVALVALYGLPAHAQTATKDAPKAEAAKAADKAASDAAAKKDEAKPAAAPKKEKKGGC
ncbi:hypothetical protein [Azohydromonas sediminis]|uniref:hypothetical protein n=1 Tax=Azohydromonas sediminis TaxID=2259674 RepID=UPI0013C35F2F|nr:hypothetical protein [Azohydromonas sediminis]